MILFFLLSRLKSIASDSKTTVPKTKYINGVVSIDQFREYCFFLSHWKNKAKIKTRKTGDKILISCHSILYSFSFFISSNLATYSLDFEKDSEKYRIPFNEKKNSELTFRGFLYGMRYELNKLNPKLITNKKIPSYDYVKELNENRINLSLNGAGEICNRDIEILSVGSVLFRPKLEQKFHNPLIPNEHYITFDVDNNPTKQWEIIQNKFDEIRNNFDYIKGIAENGLEWYKNNGTIQSNVDILKEVININKLK